jgi:hypothetical protein
MSMPNTMPSTARKEGAELNSASRKNGGEKIWDCGSAICGKPAKTLGVQKGLSPAANARARNTICG